MGSISDIFGKKSKPKGNGPRSGNRSDEEIFQPGDIIGGKYEVHRRLGRGGFGLVYLVYNRETKEVLALKTFRDELLADAAARQAFKKEALLWVNLEEHPFILPARWVDEFSGRLFVQMDYIAPDERGRVSLTDHLVLAGGPLEKEQVLEWAIQFCHGMEYAAAHGIRAHRDIKPDNILLTGDGRVQIADFGLAAAAGAGHSFFGTPVEGGRAGYSLSIFQSQGKQVCGTPGYISPEVFEGKGAAVPSDIYSFGVVLWQMVSGSPIHPFHPDGFFSGPHQYPAAVYALQTTGRLPEVDGPLGKVVERCLQPDPARRFSDFAALRAALEPGYSDLTGRSVTVPPGGEKTASFWNNKGASLRALGRYEEAISCYERALELDPRYANAWNNKGFSLYALGRYEEAISCYERSLELDPRNAEAWFNKALVEEEIGRRREAAHSYRKFIELAPPQYAQHVETARCRLRELE